MIMKRIHVVIALYTFYARTTNALSFFTARKDDKRKKTSTLDMGTRLVSKGLQRKLSFQSIAGYEPASSVTDMNAIDLDQYVMEAQLSLQNEEGFAKAKSIYEDGGSSKPYAVLTLVDTNATSPPFFDVGMPISGLNSYGNQIFAKVYTEQTFASSGTLYVQYDISDVQENRGCQVGALVDTGYEHLDGCFTENGVVTDDEGNEYAYTYDPLVDNKNGRNLQQFSLNAQHKMIECPYCPLEDAMNFKNYYGDIDFGDKLIQAAFAGNSTSFSSGRGNADFTSLDLGARLEAVKKTTVTLITFLYIIRQLEHSVQKCIDNKPSAIEEWDKGVALYVGSMEGNDGNGKLLYALADKRCFDFNTCVDIGQSSISKVNQEAMNLFQTGQFQIMNGQCSDARDTKSSIAKLMYIPLIQGVLRYSYNVDMQGGDEKAAAGAVFAAAILPKIHQLSPEKAEIIYNNTKIGANETSFLEVKTAFELVYEDFGIKCKDIGGLVDRASGEYQNNAEPCGVTESPSMAPSSEDKSEDTSEAPEVFSFVGQPGRNRLNIQAAIIASLLCLPFV